jgi:hypothetical protein
MYCPNCSQQQASDETRFCSRCGFQLGVVKALLSSDPSAPAPAPAPDPARRQKDLTLGAALMFLSALAVAAVTVELPPGHSNRIVVLVVAWLLLTLLINLRPLLRYFLGEKAPAAAHDAADLTTRVGGAPHNSALPPARAVPAAQPAAQQFDTAEVVHPPSVTERTTNLLGRE